MQRPRFARIVDMAEASRGWCATACGREPNDLIADYPWVSGVKTGFTANAGIVLGARRKGPTARV